MDLLLTIDKKNSRMKEKALIGIMLVSGLIYGLFCLTVKATFWWDSIVYIELSEYMKSLVFWRDYHNSEYRFLFQHIGYGLSGLIRLIELIQGNDSLISLIIFQNLLNWLSVSFLAYTIFEKYKSLSISIVTIALCSFSSFYLMFNNAYMTESINASLLNFGIGIILRSKFNDLRPFVILSLIFFLSFQFRISTPIILMCFLMAKLINSSFSRSKFLTFLIIFCLGYALMPVFRYVTTDKFYFPNHHSIQPRQALFYNPNPSKQLVQDLEDYFKNDVSILKIREFGYPDFAILANDMSINGMNDSQVRENFSELVKSIKYDNWNTISNSLLIAATSLGFTHHGLLQRDQREIAFNYTAEKFSSHVRNHYKWLQWRSGNYTNTFESFLTRFNKDQEVYLDSSITKLKNNLKGRIVEQRSLSQIWFIDYLPPFLLTSLAIIFAILGLFQSRYRGISISILLSLTSYLFLSFLASAGNPRYFHGIYIVAVLGASFFCTLSLEKIFYKFKKLLSFAYK